AVRRRRRLLDAGRRVHSRFRHEAHGAIARLDRRRPRGQLSRNTWGGGLYYVFRSVAEAGRFALDLRDMTASTDWTRHGFPHALSLRIGLHAGPVYVLPDPVLRRTSYNGSHVNWAARIEPITVPGARSTPACPSPPSRPWRTCASSPARM